MILEDKTFLKYGYYSTDWRQQSGKPIIALCEDCRKTRTLKMQDYHDLCKSCVKKGKKHPIFGKHRTEEEKTKISAGLKGSTHAEEHKARISKGLKDNKNGQGNGGKKHTEETKTLMSIAKKGNKHPNWLGGISFEPYCIKFNEAYKKIVRDKFNNRCFWCGLSKAENGRALSVHHVNYNKQCGCDKTKCICVPLCARCHARTNGNRDGWEKLLAKKIELLTEEEVGRED
jgi:hypothetical protein